MLPSSSERALPCHTPQCCLLQLRLPCSTHRFPTCLDAVPGTVLHCYCVVCGLILLRRREDLADLPPESDLEAYAAMPVDQFGMALLRCGWWCVCVWGGGRGGQLPSLP